MIIPNSRLFLATLLIVGSGLSPMASIASSDTKGPDAWTWMGKVKQVAPGPSKAMPILRDAKSIRITLKRGACFGKCPIYSVEVNGLGDVSYLGSQYVLIEGHHKSAVDPQKIRALFDRFRTNNFWSLRSKYVAPVTDNPTYELTLSFDGRSKTVTDYVGRAVGMPAAVTELENAVDAVADVEKWTVGNYATIPALKHENWQFATAEGARVLARASEDAPDVVAFGLIEAGAPVRLPENAAANGSEDVSSALDNASLMARLELARKLIRMGAAEGSGAKNTALRAAVASAHPVMVAEILKLRPDVNLTGADDFTPLMWIEAGPHPFGSKPEQTDTPAVIRLLVAAGADPNLGFKKSNSGGWAGAGNTEGDTVLHMTSSDENARQYLLSGAKVDQRNSKGETPILTTYSEDVALALLDNGATANVQSNEGLTLLKWATIHQWKTVLGRLRATH